MKVGILTCHAAYNYGSVLQAYALQEAVGSLGCECEVIDYRPFWFNSYRVLYWENPFKSSLRQFVRTVVKNIYNFLCVPIRIERKRKFERFLNRTLKMSHWRGANGRDIPQDYDIYLVGSDQVWNPIIFGDSLPYYMGRLARKPGSRLVGYGISAGEGERLLNAEHVNDVIKFDALSVRELSLRLVIRNLSGRESPVVLDPTLLVPREFWLTRSRDGNYGDYVLVYMVHPVRAALKFAKQRAQELSCKVRVIPSGAGFVRSGRLHQYGPEEFLDLFRNARAVITTSFHGTVFSIVFGRPFYYIKCNPSAETRQRTLLAHIGLEGRMASPCDVLAWPDIDYGHAWERLAALRKESLDFLRLALKESK